MPESYPQIFPPPWAEAWGDDRYGLWAELLVGDVTQRMRWIAPGSFMMGEEPPHEESLTEELWLGRHCLHASLVANSHEKQSKPCQG